MDNTVSKYVDSKQINNTKLEISVNIHGHTVLDEINWECMENIASKYVDSKQINNTKLEISANTHGQSVNSVSWLKTQTDKTDLSILYTLHKRKRFFCYLLLNKKLGIVFKTSKDAFQANIGLLFFVSIFFSSFRLPY